eukprot:scaffold23505_cov119-Cylindrotheca_fusiformis.AAC.5
MKILFILNIAVHVGFPNAAAFSAASSPAHRRTKDTSLQETQNGWMLRSDSDPMLEDLALKRCCYPFDEEVRSFYRNNFHKKRNKRQVPSLPKSDEDCIDDAIYVLKASQGNVLAALRLTRSKDDSTYTFLRSLCVSRDYRRHGLALQLIDKSLDHFSSSDRCCYCFASPYLETLYQQAGFLRISKNDMQAWPKWLIHSYNSMDARWSRKTLGLFLRPPSSPSAMSDDNDNDATRIVLLQHGLEFSKKTATGWLLDDNLYSKNPITSALADSKHLLPHLKVLRWVWNGRNDTSRIESQIHSLLESSTRVYLLWTTYGRSEASGMEGTESKSEAAFIILDGTWQQAKTLFRRIPALWNLPRLSLSDIPPSTYILRGDYSGWKERFGGADTNRDEGRTLLCTAEVAAVILKQQGDVIGSNLVLSRLEKFQTAFLQQRDGPVLGTRNENKI